MNNCGPKVLDILFKIKNEIDPSLTFRRSCAHGVCGSCAMNVDGVNTLSCIKSHTDINGDLNIYPLPHLKVIKDLIGDLSGLYKQYESIQPWLKTSQTGQEKKETTTMLGSEDGEDELYNQALEIIKTEGKASTSFLQRKLQIGYNRAARIIDMMEEKGIVSKANHVGKREVL